MEELRDKANSYAEENVLDVLKEAFAKVYADGYRDGFRDCKENVSVNLHFCKTEYVDLGLPSGTLWSTDYEKGEGELMYVPYELTVDKSIPTKEQWKELKKCAKWEFIDEEDMLTAVKCTGPNGNTLLFRITGLMDFAKITHPKSIFFWVKSATERNCAVHMWTYNNELHEDTDKLISRWKLPIRLVRAK